MDANSYRYTFKRDENGNLRADLEGETSGKGNEEGKDEGQADTCDGET